MLLCLLRAFPGALDHCFSAAVQDPLGSEYNCCNCTTRMYRFMRYVVAFLPLGHVYHAILCYSGFSLGHHPNAAECTSQLDWCLSDEGAHCTFRLVGVQLRKCEVNTVPSFKAWCSEVS